MKKCKKCGKKHLSYHPCGIEKELESILPKKEVSAIKKKPVFYILISFLITAVFIVLSAFLLYSMETIKKERDVISALSLTLSRRSNELSALEKNLEATAEGKSTLEKARLEAEAEANNLEKGLEQTKNKLSKAQNDIIESTYYAEKLKRDVEAIKKEVEEKRLEIEQKEEFLIRFNELDILLESFTASATKTLNSMENNNIEESKTNLSQTQDFYYKIINKLTELKG